MRIKILGILAAVALVSACETASEGSGKSSGSGVANAKPVEVYSPPLGGSAGVRAGSQEDLVVNVGDRVFFGFDQFNLTNDARQTLDKQVAWLKGNPSVTVTIEGHADERGTREYNLALGERRANAVKDYLAAMGVNPARVKTISYGKEKPVALGSNEAAWRQNRRSVTTVGGAGS
ncbi:MAG: peptidoglycan-associated lipoprotein Pal [Magnetovibrio sp.]|nr:peptidoglycan-associated lipoprotein Pal [Magnetovibrio sp.]